MDTSGCRPRRPAVEFVYEGQEIVGGFLLIGQVGLCLLATAASPPRVLVPPQDAYV